MDYLLLLSSIVLGALSVFLFKLYEPRHVKLLNAFTGAFLLSLTLLHLLPELYHARIGEAAHDDLLIGGLIPAGVFTPIGLDGISMGAGHGPPPPLHGGMAVGVVGGLFLHAPVEGMAPGKDGAQYYTAA